MRVYADFNSCEHGVEQCGAFFFQKDIYEVRVRFMMAKNEKKNTHKKYAANKVKHDIVFLYELFWGEIRTKGKK